MNEGAGYSRWWPKVQKNGLTIDQQNRNPSRLSRMPGILRGSQRQTLLETNIGKSCWDEWRDWLEAETDELPEAESLADDWESLPPLADALITGVLRKGHKMLLAGPSKAGKSFALIELCIAIAEGRPWLGRFSCAQGKVLYINLELDRASCLHRFKDVYTALGLPPQNLRNIDIWNLRGASVPMVKLAPKLIRRAQKKGYTAVILDPIYKVITGDENSADQMAKFCNQFDLVCRALDCAVIYCHHHSKGAQGGKRSMDRASGSGVFARDPDAMLDMTELVPTDAIREQLHNKAACRVIKAMLDKRGHGDAYGPDDALSRSRMLAIAKEHLPLPDLHRLDADTAAAIKRADAMTAWRIEGTLREFARFDPVNLWFDYPVHKLDSGLLEDLRSYAEEFDHNSESLMLFGNAGLGKTHAALAIAGIVLQKDFDVIYVSSPDFFGKLENARFDSSEDAETLLRTASAADLLILDDLGTEFVTPYFITTFYSLLNNRLGAGLPTIVTTNIADGSLLEKRYTEKISSRLSSFVPCLFAGEDIRGLKAAE